ncbi:two-component response regulator [Companilactobacillus paralimentarius DSM 13238 = JCM 10415]|jgi:Response regulator containing a CheY-like receiver domain and an HTH DNA-binding domain|uniref:Two-component response regulator n=1 Tax=Companilactobacillus paralimentarius DSM 13238 = JCM 10415 TaxID=1122151 RepID=A0A0R1PIL3_9LACO|nr:response regulator transcription factor [Companilactobacillus paralimentarius]KAE9562661.1 two-component system response regulator [Companilactobacillus paralimentarius]KRL32157.1 two-component response regulator [Companilactobacillus paralimentarius DSM 13238 = JCM 10415]MDR4933891.1 response regulator transcription factor [Companilactobacillus paralimentarius]QFR70314.1 response regulator [Companilactobacillus paralimentarius]
MTSIYIAEDQEMLNSALSAILNLEDDFTVIGNATEGQTALKEIISLKPDVAILDIEMPQMTGLEVAKELRLTKQDLKIVILTTFARKIYFELAVAAQVNAYLLKDGPTDKLVDTIHKILDGQTIYDSNLVSTILTAVKNPLTPQELKIMKEFSQGKSTQEIADSVFLSNGTVRNYISSILSKTGTHSRIEALNIAKKNNWIE